MARGGKAIKSILFGMALIVAVSCTTQYRNHGYMPPDEDIAAITLGVDTRDTVVETLGSPSAGGVLKDGSFYYVRSRVRTYGAREPKVIERKVMAVDFDNRGIARNIRQFGLEDGRAVPLVVRVTDGNLGNVSFLKQLLGSIGNFDPSGFGI
ncbi:outer membrane protein assembly factor BamE [Thiosulfatihalobacter marinus]|jgi:outer membrane protein assembly factor BamE (lipoprotein component of BamABCDE complex)|uniref:outer membrane protein assembly factor BamE n=1 Tax=Thiosulfatihalobacter marinus TaxID=2792481 RepID=UPI0018D99E1C|nr:outer membrane protein assembly factor BamE [Thiosulfatihalobacter marinus]